MNRRIVALTAGLALTVGVLTACGSDQGSGEPETLTVFAAASLTDTFKKIGTKFEAENDDVTVTFSFAGSSDLVTQITAGAPADVFASANEENMDKATAGDLTAEDPRIFATNTLTIAVPTGNPGKVRGLDDLARPDLETVVCAPEVPCGAATVRVEKSSRIDVKPVSEEQNVTDVLNKVAAGEADAGLVYVTDIARAAGDVTAVDFPESSAAVNRYPIGPLADSDHQDVARAFVDFVLSSAGQAVLGDAGFGKP